MTSKSPASAKWGAKCRPQEEGTYRTPLVSNHTSKQLPGKPRSPSEVWHPDTAAGWRERLAEVKGRPTSTVGGPGHADPNRHELTAVCPCFHGELMSHFWKWESPRLSPARTAPEMLLRPHRRLA